MSRGHSACFPGRKSSTRLKCDSVYRPPLNNFNCLQLRRPYATKAPDLEQVSKRTTLDNGKSQGKSAEATTSSEFLDVKGKIPKLDKRLLDSADELISYLGMEKTGKAAIILKIVLTVIAGLYFGAFLAKLGANLLEEYEIFVRGEDGED